MLHLLVSSVFLCFILVSKHGERRDFGHEKRANLKTLPTFIKSVWWKTCHPIRILRLRGSLMTRGLRNLWFTTKIHSVSRKKNQFPDYGLRITDHTKQLLPFYVHCRYLIMKTSKKGINNTPTPININTTATTKYSKLCKNVIW